MSKKYNIKHLWKIELINPVSEEIIDQETVERIENSKFINNKISVPKLKSYFYIKHKSPLFKIYKISPN